MLEVLEAVDGSALYRWADACVTGIEKRCDEINDLNVFPVPDADTGTNLLATMRAAGPGRRTTVRGRARGRRVRRGPGARARGGDGRARKLGCDSLPGAAGVAESTKSHRLDADTFRSALRHASDLALEAVSVPMEGTIVTVLAAAADAVAAETAGAPLARLSAVAADAAAEALLRTPSQLAVLGAAGVVDAGGRGLVVILDALVEVICGVPPAREAFLAPAGDGCGDRRGARVCGPAHLVHEVAGQDYEVMYLVAESDEARIADLRGRLCSLGDSVVIVGDGFGRDAHVVGPRALQRRGSRRRGRTRGRAPAQRSHHVFSCSMLPAPTSRTPPPHARCCPWWRAGRGGNCSSRRARGYCGPTAPSPEQLLAAIRGTGRREVVVLPNGALPAQDLIAVGARARADARDVVFLPSSSMVQALAALAVHDAERLAVDDAFAMSEAAAATRWGSLRVAEERALTYVGTCEPGDGLGLVGHEVVVIERDVVAAGCRLVDLVLGAGGELVTVLLGAQASEGLGERVAGLHHVPPSGGRGDGLPVVGRAAICCSSASSRRRVDSEHGDGTTRHGDADG